MGPNGEYSINNFLFFSRLKSAFLQINDFRDEIGKNNSLQKAADMLPRAVVDEKHRTGIDNIAFLGDHKQIGLEIIEKRVIQKANLIQPIDTFARIRVDGHDIHGTSYVRNSATPSDKNSSFFLYTPEDHDNNAKCDLNNGLVGRARFFFKQDNEAFCVFEAYGYEDSTFPAPHGKSAFHKIDLEFKKIDIIPLSRVVSRVTFMGAEEHSLREDRGELGIHKIALVIRPTHHGFEV